jgi:hypothetical protein
MDAAGSNPSRFVAWLVAAMEARKVGVRQLAKYADLSASGLSSLLRGETSPSVPREAGDGMGAGLVRRRERITASAGQAVPRQGRLR